MAARSLTTAQRETLALFDTVGAPRTTSEIAEQLDLGRRTVYGRLERLVEQGALETKKVGANARVWWRPPRLSSSEAVIDGEKTSLISLLVDSVEEYAIFLLDEEGFVRSWNEGASQIKGYEAEEIVGEHFSTFYTDDDQVAGVPEENLTEAAETGRVEDTGWRVRRDDSRFWADVSITAIRDEQDELRGFAKVTRDMTERRDQEEAIRQERELLDRILETSPIGLGVLSRDGLERVNTRAAEIYGSPTDDIDEYSVGEPAVYDTEGEPVPPGERPNARVFATGERVTGWECQLYGIDGLRRWLSVNAAPLTDDAGDVERVVVATEDITHFKEQARRLESQRDELEAEIDEVFERVDDAFCALDGEFRFTYVNDLGAELLQVDAGELLGECIWDLYPEASQTPVWDGLHDAMETQSSTEFEVYAEELDVWLHASVYPSETGLSVYFRDVTKRKERERALRTSEERFRALMEHSPFSMQIFDDKGRPIETNPAWEQLWNASREELADYNILQDPQLEAAGLLPHIRGAFDGEVVELPVIDYDPAEIGKSGRARWIEGYAYPLVTGDDETVEIALVHHDITERKARERELERYETIIETVDDGIYLVDEDGYLTMVNEGYAELTGYPLERLVGMHVSELVDEETVERARTHEQELVAGERERARFEADVLTADGDSVRAEGVFSIIDRPDHNPERVGVVRDVSDRVARERELELYEAIVSAINDGVYVLDEAFDFIWVNDAYAEMTGYDHEELLGTHCTLVVDDAVSDESAERLQDIANGRASSATLEADILRADGTSLRAESNFTVLPKDGSDEWKVGVVRDVSERVAREQELARQRERLATLNDLNRIVRDLSGAAIDQSTRAEIERTVCEGLAATDAIQFAWIGEVEGEAMTVRVRTEAGVDGFLAEGTDTIDLNAPGDLSIVAEAVTTQEVQVVEEALDNEKQSPEMGQVSNREPRSAVAVPIIHEGTSYGVLAVYADQPDSFTDGGGEAIGHLGEIVGHAISATQQRRALTSNEIVEIEFRVPDFCSAFDLPSSDGRITFDRAVPVGNGIFLEYGTADPVMLDVLEALVETLPHWESVQFLDGADGGAESRFELRLIEPPLLSCLTAVGGYIERAVIEDNEFVVRLHLPPSADVRQVSAVVEEEYPMAEMLSRRQVTREPQALDQTSQLLVGALTDRQRAVLETAFFSGYFESPRSVTGGYLADSLGIASPTFHAHLRNAQRTVFEDVLEY